MVLTHLELINQISSDLSNLSNAANDNITDISPYLLC